MGRQCHQQLFRWKQLSSSASGKIQSVATSASCINSPTSINSACPDHINEMAKNDSLQCSAEYHENALQDRSEQPLKTVSIPHQFCNNQQSPNLSQHFVLLAIGRKPQSRAISNVTNCVFGRSPLEREKPAIPNLYARTPEGEYYEVRMYNFNGLQ